MLKIHCLTHVPFEDAANIGLWAQENGHQLQYTHLYNSHHLPQTDEFEILAIMGGPMNIYEYKEYSWLRAEKEFIKQAIDSNKRIIGVCLGAQLIADVLGGKVIQNEHKEIGWFEINQTNASKNATVFSRLPKEFMAFHWHGDTFEIPPSAIHLATSQACNNQAFQYGDNVIGLQFHLDYSKESIEKMLDNCSGELVNAPYVQTQEQIRQQYNNISEIKELLYTLLNSFCH